MADLCQRVRRTRILAEEQGLPSETPASAVLRIGRTAPFMRCVLIRSKKRSHWTVRGVGVAAALLFALFSVPHALALDYHVQKFEADTSPDVVSDLKIQFPDLSRGASIAKRVRIPSGSFNVDILRVESEACADDACPTVVRYETAAGHVFSFVCACKESVEVLTHQQRFSDGTLAMTFVLVATSGKITVTPTNIGPIVNLEP